MSTIAAIGAAGTIDGFALVGVTVVTTPSDGAVLEAWRSLGPEVGLVILTTDASRVLGPYLDERTDTLTVTVP